MVWMQTSEGSSRTARGKNVQYLGLKTGQRRGTGPPGSSQQGPRPAVCAAARLAGGRADGIPIPTLSNIHLQILRGTNADQLPIGLADLRANIQLAARGLFALEQEANFLLQLPSNFYCLPQE